MVARLQGTLRGAGVELSPRELSDALWLALHTPPRQATVAVPAPKVEPRPAVPAPPAEPRTAPKPSTVPRRPSPRQGVTEQSEGSRRPVYALTRRQETGASGAPVRIPGVRGLPRPLGVARGLRALKRKVPSPRGYELDEAATAEAIAHSGILDAVLRPAQERWLHLVLALDDGPSMSVWRDTIQELTDVLATSGIFRSVRVCSLEVAVGSLLDHTTTLVVTDGVADHWYTGSAHAHLSALARRAPTAVLHLFPTRLWSSTAMAAEPMVVRSRGPGQPNALLTSHAPWLPAALGPELGLAVPVVELAEWGLRPWAELLASPGGVASLRVVDAERPPDPVPSDAAIRHAPAAQRVRAFRATASPQAYELAGHLASVDPLTLPVMRVVQAAALPDSSTACLSEVLLSGLMHVDDSLGSHDVFAFSPDVRAMLRTVIRASSAQRTVDAVSDFIAPRLDRTPDFPAVIAHRTGTLALPRQGSPFAELPPLTTPVPHPQRPTSGPRQVTPPQGLLQPPTGQPTVGPGYQAVLRYREPNGSEQVLIRRSAPGTPHPEWQIFHELRAMNVPPDQVLALHTELESCDLPGAYCARMIREQWPQARITSIAPYGADSMSRQQGMRQLLEYHAEMHQVADGHARPAPVRVPLPPVQAAPQISSEDLAREMADAFGTSLFQFERQAVARQGVPPVVAESLLVAGLPIDMDPFFWAQTEHGRSVPTLAELARERGVQPTSDAESYLVMGSDYGQAICVQYGTANIVAVPVEANPRGNPVSTQFVNTGLPEFQRCLALLGRMWRLRFGLNH
ncbi:SAV_2336 N-terminal domain-related protein, partial [Streptomyces sp. NPDC101110]|uniref:SAV_2336 N-terminal domain-related protein n=1 Tax=Streptomyces sp. NPDC101110 TaxID=3366104 RepID=UPI0038219BFE